MTISEEEATRRMQLFDWDEMKHASDRVSVKQLRNISGNSIGVTDRFEIEDKLCFSSLATLIDLERQLTFITYCKAARVPERMAGVTYAERDEIIEYLSEQYTIFRATQGEARDARAYQIDRTPSQRTG